MTYEEQYLMHHGVEGQQWGVQNGPPYPLDSSISDGERLKESALNKYKNKELKKLEKTHKQRNIESNIRKNTYAKKVLKYDSNTKKGMKYKAKELDEIEFNKKLESLYLKELEAISNMKYDDMKYEKSEKAKQIIKSSVGIGVSTIAGVAVLPLFGISPSVAGMIVGTAVSQSINERDNKIPLRKTEMRTGEKLTYDRENYKNYKNNYNPK